MLVLQGLIISQSTVRSEEKPPLGAVITHTLKLICHVPSGHKEFYIALDSNDLVELK